MCFVSFHRSRLAVNSRNRKVSVEDMGTALSWTVTSRVWYLFRPVIQLLLTLRARLRGKPACPVPHMTRDDGVEVLVNTLGPNPARPPDQIRDLEKKLWSGYSHYALTDLERVLHTREMPSHYRAKVAWVLARWHSAHGDFEKALLYAVLMRALHPAEGWWRGQVLLEVDCLNRVGRHAEAQAMLDHVLAVEPLETDYCLAYANCLLEVPSADEERLGWINRVYEEAGFAPIALYEQAQGLSIENLSAPSARAGARQEDIRVSILMPAYNCADTIQKAIRGLLEQTWANIEIIVVDDCSPDDTWAVLSALADQDDRVTAIRHEQNTGAYGARLTALEQASGNFITVHDADDWSHPQKIEAQVDALMADESLVACMSSWCRVSRSMYVNRVGAIPSDSFRRQNESSLMFRRRLVDEIGCWDRVRAAADTEYIWRIEAAYGRQAIRIVHPDVPLSFSLHQEDSLTRTGPTHVRTIFHGTRRVYREAQRWWHSQAGKPSDLKLAPGESRPFYCPPNLLEKRPSPRRYDVLVVADFAVRGEAVDAAIAVVKAAISRGWSVATFQWRRYEGRPIWAVADAIQAMAAAGQVDILAAEDSLKARHALVVDPLGPRHLLERLPDWQVDQVWVAGEPLDDEDRHICADPEPEVVKANLTQAFGVSPTWLSGPMTGKQAAAWMDEQLVTDGATDGSGDT